MSGRCSGKAQPVGYLGTLFIFGLQLSLLIAVVIATFLTVTDDGSPWFDHSQSGFFDAVIGFSPVVATGLALMTILAYRRTDRSVVVPLGSGIVISLIGLSYLVVHPVIPFIPSVTLQYGSNVANGLLVVLTTAGGLSLIVAAIYTATGRSLMVPTSRVSWAGKIPLFVVIAGLGGALFVPVYQVSATAWNLLIDGVFVTVGIVFALQVWRLSVADTPHLSVYIIEALAAIVVLYSIPGLLMDTGISCPALYQAAPSTFGWHMEFDMSRHWLLGRGCRVAVNWKPLLLGSGVLIAAPTIGFLVGGRDE